MMCPIFYVLNFRKKTFTMLYKASKSLENQGITCKPLR